MKDLSKGFVGLVVMVALALFVAPGQSQPPCSHPIKVNAGYVRPVVIGIPVAPDYYYTIGDEETPEERDARIAEAVIKKFEERFEVKGVGTVKEELMSRDLFHLIGEKRVPANTGGVERGVLSLFERGCIKCHKPAASKPGSIQLFTVNRKLFVDSDPRKERLRRERVYESIASGEMPKNDTPWTAGEKSLLQEWVNLAK